MAIFEVTIQGKTFEVDAPDENALPDIVDTIAEREGLNAQTSQNRIDNFLPNKGKVTEAISKRQSPIDSLRQEVMQPWGVDQFLKKPVQTTLRPLVTGLKVAALPFQALESGVANAGLAAQEGKGIVDILKSGAKGVVGKENAQLGDIIRTTGVGGKYGNEFLSSVIGFAGSVGLSNLATKGKLLEGANKVKNEIQAGRESAKTKSTFYLKNKAEALQEGHGQIKKAIGHEIGEIHNKIGDTAINSDDIMVADEVIDRIPKALVNRFQRQTGTAVGKGQIKNIKDVRTLKDLVGRSIPDRVWKGLDSPTPEQMALKDDYFELSDIIANYAGNSRAELMALNQKYKKIVDAGEVIGSLTKDRLGLTNPTGLKNIRSTANQGKLEAMLNFSKEFMPEAEKIIKDIDKYNRNEKIGKALQGALKYGAITGGGIMIGKSMNQQ